MDITERGTHRCDLEMLGAEHRLGHRESLAGEILGFWQAVQLAVHACQVVEGGGDIRVFVRIGLAERIECELIARRGAVVAALGAIDPREVVECDAEPRIVGLKHLAVNGQGTLDQFLGLVQAFFLIGDRAEIGSAQGGAEVIAPERRLEYRKRPLVLDLRIVVAAEILVQHAEVIEQNGEVGVALSFASHDDIDGASIQGLGFRMPTVDAQYASQLAERRDEGWIAGDKLLLLDIQSGPELRLGACKRPGIADQDGLLLEQLGLDDAAEFVPVDALDRALVEVDGIADVSARLLGFRQLLQRAPVAGPARRSKLCLERERLTKVDGCVVEGTRQTLGGAEIEIGHCGERVLGSGLGQQPRKRALGDPDRLDLATGLHEALHLGDGLLQRRLWIGFGFSLCCGRDSWPTLGRRRLAGGGGDMQQQCEQGAQCAGNANAHTSPDENRGPQK